MQPDSSFPATNFDPQKSSTGITMSQSQIHEMDIDERINYLPIELREKIHKGNFRPQTLILEKVEQHWATADYPYKGVAQAAQLVHEVPYHQISHRETIKRSYKRILMEHLPDWIVVFNFEEDVLAISPYQFDQEDGDSIRTIRERRMKVHESLENLDFLLQANNNLVNVQNLAIGNFTWDVVVDDTNRVRAETERTRLEEAFRHGFQNLKKLTLVYPKDLEVNNVWWYALGQEEIDVILKDLRNIFAKVEATNPSFSAPVVTLLNSEDPDAPKFEEHGARLLYDGVDL